MSDIHETPREVVVGLMEDWGKGWDAFVNGFDKRLDENCVYSNIGFPTWHGKEQIMQSMEASRQEFSLERITIDFRNIVVSGDVVVVERYEHWFDDKNQPIFPEPEEIMGIFVVRNGKITEFRDYFDPRLFLKLLADKQSKSEAFFD